MNRRSRSILAVALVAPLLAATAQAAVADSADRPDPGKGAQAAVAPGSGDPTKMPQLSALAALPGYRQVSSSLFTDSPQAQTFGSVSCPTNTKVVGGGVVISGSSLSENVNSSVPSSDGTGWRAYVNNSTTTAGSFRVYAVCVKKVSKYAVVIGTGVDNPNNTQTQATVTCPQGTFPLGGGGFASSGSTAVNLNTSIPLAKGWRTDVNNNSSVGSNTATAFAVCGKKPTGYAQVAGASVTVNASSQQVASVACPSGTLVLGGGVFSSSGSTAVDLNSTIPSGSGAWASYENNGLPTANSMTPYAVCGQASS